MAAVARQPAAEHEPTVHSPTAFAAVYSQAVASPSPGLAVRMPSHCAWLTEVVTVPSPDVPV